MTWTEERHGSKDKGYRSAKAYVGQLWSGYWRVWVFGPDGGKLQPEVFHSDREARHWAEEHAA